MLAGPTWLALEVKYLDPAVSFYREHLDLPTRRTAEHDVAFGVGDTDLVLREPSTVPRGGLHTHYAFSTTSAAYDDWWDRLSVDFDLVEHQFGDARSLYFYDTEGNCVEVGERSEGVEGSGAGGGPVLTGIFEVVLEVEDLDRAEAFYTDLGFDLMDRGEARQRTRLTCGAFDIELWEPHLGLAEARGGVHVDLGIAADDPVTAVEAVRNRALAVERRGEQWQLRDPDGHYVTLV